MITHAFGRRISKVTAIVAFVGVLAFPAIVSAVAAGEGSQHIVATPSSAELSIAPGDTTSASLEIINQGTNSFGVKTSAAPYHVEGIEYDPQFTRLPGTVDASKWVKLAVPASTTLTPGKLLHINYTVTVPAQTAPGGYYAVIFAETTPVASGGGVVAHNRVGEILYLTVKGRVKKQGSASAGTLDRFNMSGKLTIPTLVRNSGGVHFKSTVTVTVKNIFGKQVYRHHEERYVLPQTERRVAIDWNSVAPLGFYKVARQATVPNGTVQLPTKWVVMVQPWLLVALLIIVAALITALVRRLQARRK